MARYEHKRGRCKRGDKKQVLAWPSDRTVTANKIWLSDSGRRKAIALFEERLNDTYVHPHTGQSMAYSRMVELELRLLEKEWTGESQLPLS